MGTVTPRPYHLVHAKQIRQRKQHRQLVVVLLEPLLPSLHKAELTCDEPEQVIQLCADTGLELLKGSDCFVFTRALLEFLELLGRIASVKPLLASTPICAFMPKYH